MTFDPRPGQRLSLNGSEIEFLPLDGSGDHSTYVYAEEGGEATVYKVRRGRESYALKVFHPAFRHNRVAIQSDRLRTYAAVDGLQVANRWALTRDVSAPVISRFPDLEFAVLMPWIQGNIWGNIIAD